MYGQTDKYKPTIINGAIMEHKSSPKGHRIKILIYYECLLWAGLCLT